MTSSELATKLNGKLEFMIKQYLPAPTCASKQEAHKQKVEEVKRLVAQQLSPQGTGVTINITP